MTHHDIPHQPLTPQRAEVCVLLLAALSTVATVHVLPHAAYVPANLALALLAVVVARRAGLTLGELGLDVDQGTLRRGLVLGLGAACVVLAVVGLALLIPASRQVFASQQSPPVGPFGMTYESLIRIPIGTALVEEVLFRGVILGLALQRTALARALASTSLWFGLWHILPTTANQQAARAGHIPLTAAELLLSVAVAVLATSSAGIIFGLLRLRSGSVLAPTLLHATLNLAGLWAVRITAGA